MQEFLLCFVPLFFAVDAIGVLPMFIGMTEDLKRVQVRKIILQSLVTALVVAVLFVLAGQLLFDFLGISIADFMIAGGLLLFIISIRDLFSLTKTQRNVDVETIGAVPIGVPLIVGPAVLTTTLICTRQHNIFLTIGALVLNIIIAGITFWFAQYIIKFLGSVGTKVVSKLASIILTALGIMMIRKGVMAVFSEFTNTALLIKTLIG
jgi:multiple antibiotic resistance protein